MSSDNLNYILLGLMMIQCFLSGSSFNTLQIIAELLIFIILIYKLFLIKLDKTDLTLLLITAIVFLFSFILNDLRTSLLNFKIFGLCTLILIYFTKINFFPGRFIRIFIIFNIAYVFSAKFLNFWPVESSIFFMKKAEYLYSRPASVLASPHVLSTFLSIYFLYLYFFKKNKTLQLLIIISLFLINSYTAIIALIFSWIYLFITKKIRIPVRPVLFFGTVLFVVFLSLQLIIYYSDEYNLPRFFSLQIMLSMIYDLSFYEGIFSLIPANHDDFIYNQESSFANIGNELGFVKIFVEGGFILGGYVIFLLMKKIKFYGVFILFTLLHYFFFINVPIVLFLAIILNNQVEFHNSKNLLLK